MAKMIDKKPTYNGEAKVWERLNEYLPNDIVVRGKLTVANTISVS